MTAAKKPAGELPAATFADAYEYLRRPFTPAAVRFKVQAQWPKNNPTGALIVAFIDARLATGRLNAVCPHLWSTQFAPPPANSKGGKGLICHLTIDGITRSDFGQGDYENSKADFSDALKRAAVHFGVGESLYVLPKMILNVGNLLKVKNGDRVEVTPAGDNHCRQVYKDWLTQTGIAAFGEPLDHGDVEYEAPEIIEEAPVELTGLEALAAAANRAGLPGSKRKPIGEWLHDSDGVLDEAKLATAIERIDNGDVDGLMKLAEPNGAEAVA